MEKKYHIYLYIFIAACLLNMLSFKNLIFGAFSRSVMIVILLMLFFNNDFRSKAMPFVSKWIILVIIIVFLTLTGYQYGVLLK